MPSLTLWLEITISGSFYLATLLFLALKMLGINDFSFLISLEEYLPFYSVAAIVLSYILGILAHRLIPIVLGQPARKLGSFLKREELMKAGARTGQHYPQMVKVWQYGSSRLHQEMNIQWNMLALFMSLVLSLPLLGISSGIWLNDTLLRPLAVPVALLGIFLGLGFFVAFLRQQKTFKLVSEAAFEEMRKVAESNK